MAQVGEVAEQIRGVSYAKGDAVDESQDGYVPLLRGGNITETGLSLEDLIFVPADKVSVKQQLQEGDVVIAASSGSLASVGKAASVPADLLGTFGAFCKVLRPSSLVDDRYFHHFFQTKNYRAAASSLAAGANINNLRNEHLDEMLIPLPPFDEQRRIAAILDKADELRAKRRGALAHLDALTQAIFHAMFGRFDRSHVLSDAISGLIGGKNLVGSDDSSNEHRVLKVSAVTSGKYLEVEAKPLPSDYEPPVEHIVRAGDVIISRANTTELVGASALVEKTNGSTVLPDKLWRAVPSSKVAPRYLLAALQSQECRAEISRRSSGSGGSMKNISKPKLLSVPVALPPLELQKTFAKRVAAVERLKQHHRDQLAQLDTLFASLQHRAFKGEL